MVKLMGYYQLPGSMPVQVSFEDLFNTSFMRKYTKYRSFEKFLLGGGFHIEIQQDFEDLPEENMDAHVVKIQDSAVGRKCWMWLLILMYAN